MRNNPLREEASEFATPKREAFRAEGGGDSNSNTDVGMKSYGDAIPKELHTPGSVLSTPAQNYVRHTRGFMKDFSYMDPYDEEIVEERERLKAGKGMISRLTVATEDVGDSIASFTGMLNRADVYDLNVVDMYAAECKKLGINPLASIKEVLRRYG
jgi:hypothetical protein